WKITADPRGTFVIPNGPHVLRVPIGTLAVEEYLRESRKRVDPLNLTVRVPTQWPSFAASQRFRAVLYVEKEGFAPLLEEARIAERFDVAVMSCKGQSVTAARMLVDHLCAVGSDVPLLVVHDLDKSGFEISQRLTTVSWEAEEQDRVAYRFQNEID